MASNPTMLTTNRPAQPAPAPLCRNCGSPILLTHRVAEYRGVRMHSDCALSLRIEDLEESVSGLLAREVI